MNNIRNFAIIAHVDHGKSTLADRMLEMTGTVSGQHEAQMLDKNPISRERGITIKLAPVRMRYVMKNEKEILNSQFSNPKLDSEYILNLIDTPGHVDFSYEVERTLACVEGVILLVDATQGIQAQTIAHAFKAIEQNLAIIPAINKVDLPSAQVAETKKQIAEFLGISEDEIFEISAKTGQGVKNVLNAVVQIVSPPSSTLKVEDHLSERGQSALIFDSYYDTYRGVIAFVRVFEGVIARGQKFRLIGSNTVFEAGEVGFFKPDLVPSESLRSGEIGYVVTNLKDIHLVQVGDTIATRQVNTPLPGYRQIRPMVFSSMFPTDPDDYVRLVESMAKLTLNDAALTSEPIYSKALGSGIRVGFLGLLHADVVRERLEREFDLSIILTSPTVEYKKVVSDKGGEARLQEPIALVTLVTPQTHVGAVMKLCEESRAVFKHMDNLAQVILEYEIPISELMSHFFDRLKTVTSGYASLEWEFKEFRDADVARLEILLNLEPVEEFSEYVVRERSTVRGRELTEKLKSLIPRQQYEVKIQARYKGKIIASTRVAPLRKDVTAKLYGGDRTRKDKLLKKQKEGKKKMKQVGSVELPKDVFLKVFNNNY